MSHDLRFCGFIRSPEFQNGDWSPLSTRALRHIRHVWTLEGLTNAIKRHERERDYHFEHWTFYFTGRTRQQAIKQLWRAYHQWSFERGGCPFRRPERRPRPKPPPSPELPLRASLPPLRRKRRKPASWSVID